MGVRLSWTKGERKGQLRQRPGEGNGVALCEGSPWLDPSHCSARVPSSEEPSLTTCYSTPLSRLTLWTYIFRCFVFFSKRAPHSEMMSVCLQVYSLSLPKM